MSTGQQQKPKPSMRETAATTLLVTYTILTVHKTFLMVFMRYGFGSKAFEPNGLLAFLALLFLSAAHPVFYAFMLVWFIALVGQRIDTLRRFLKGEKGYSRGEGYPFLAMRMPGVNTEEAARRAEPFICLFAGIFIATINAPLGYLVMGGFLSFGMSMAIQELLMRQQLQALSDAEFEMQMIFQRYRGK